MTQDQRDRLEFLQHLRETIRAKRKRLEKVTNLIPYVLSVSFISIMIFTEGYLMFGLLVSDAALFLGLIAIVLSSLRTLDNRLMSAQKSYFDYLAKLTKDDETSFI